MVRRAVDSCVAAIAEPISVYFGLWANNPKTADVEGFVDELRGEWLR